jgi:hypothetical protein
MGYFGMAPDEGLESLDPDSAIRQMEEMEGQGAIHTIWTMMTPFIGAALSFFLMVFPNLCLQYIVSDQRPC